jgi:hypothetical protein
VVVTWSQFASPDIAVLRVGRPADDLHQLAGVGEHGGIPGKRSGMLAPEFEKPAPINLRRRLCDQQRTRQCFPALGVIFGQPPGVLKDLLDGAFLLVYSRA